MNKNLALIGTLGILGVVGFYVWKSKSKSGLPGEYYIPQDDSSEGIDLNQYPWMTPGYQDVLKSGSSDTMYAGYHCG